MRGLIAIALLLIVGQAVAGELPRGVRVFHDEARAVTCWLYTNGGTEGGISCLPDSSLPQGPAATATPESEAARASLANIKGETGRLPTTHDERFQL